jgi:hypothetical protein
MPKTFQAPEERHGEIPFARFFVPLLSELGIFENRFFYKPVAPTALLLEVRSRFSTEPDGF